MCETPEQKEGDITAHSAREHEDLRVRQTVAGQHIAVPVSAALAANRVIESARGDIAYTSKATLGRSSCSCAITARRMAL